MNEFDNNMNNMQNNENENSAPAPESNASFVNQNANSTYQSTYIPTPDGYTSNTAGSGSYSCAPDGTYTKAPGAAPYYVPPKKNSGISKGAVIAIAVCSFLVASVIFMFVGISIAGMVTMTKGTIEENKVAMGDESMFDSDTVAPETQNDVEAETEVTDDGTATITKTPGGSVVTVEGKVGELMSKHQVVSLVKDSVVEITTEQVVKGHSFYQYVQSGAGSGVIIAKEGHVITNNHVIDGASKITVRLTNGNEYEAKLLGTDASSDIAILKITADEELAVATLGTSAKLSVAEEVIVIGNPLGELGGTVTNGIVSALAREINIDGEKMTLIQTNAAVNPGNSGGGMFNLYGELVGIVNAKSSGSDVEGLGFAIPIDTAYDIVLQLMDYGYVRGRVDHGLELIDIGDLFTAASYRVSTLGVYVYESKYTDEIKNGDRIVSINGKEVSTSAGVKEALYGCAVGDTVNVTVARGGRFVDASLTLREYIPQNADEVSFE